MINICYNTLFFSNKRESLFFYIYKYEHNLYVYNYSKDNYWEEERAQERRNGSL